MILLIRPIRALAIGLVLAATLAQFPAQVRAQELGEPPVMENSFFNVVWGSAVGAMLGAASIAVGSGTESKSDLLRENAITGATAGGLIGLGIGIWLTFNGITFDPDRSLLFRTAAVGGSQDAGRFAAQTYRPPIEIETAPDEPFRITGAKALIFDWRF